MPDGMTKDTSYIRFSEPEDGIGHIHIDRPEARNAQDLKMLYELDDALMAAVADDNVKCIVISAADPHFNSGHDLIHDTTKEGRDFPVKCTWGGFDEEGIAGNFAREQEVYYGLCKRWRDVCKPTIVLVQGKVVAGGLMLIWPFDIVIASEDAQFKDPVLEMGVCGVEYFAHVFELGRRKAKELLFTGDWFTAEEAREMGMVNRVVPRAELQETGFAMARKVCHNKTPFALKITKMALNQAEDIMGYRTVIDSATGLHHLCHAQNVVVHDDIVDESGFPKKMMKTRFIQDREERGGK